MGFPLDLALRYMASKKRSFISMGTFFAIIGVALGVAGLATAVSVTGGFRKQFRDKVLGVNAHVLVLKRSSYFGEYREIVEQMKGVPGVVGVAPFTINPMMVTKGDRTATGVLLKGVEPEKVGEVLDLPKHIVAGSRTLEGLRVPGAKPAESPRDARRGIEGTAPALPKPEGSKEGVGGKKTVEDLPKLLDEAVEKRAAATTEEPPASEWTPGPGDLVGSIVPEGGYKSELPDEDILPESLNPDPCKAETGSLPGIVLGSTLAKNLDAGLDDCVQVTSPTIGFSFSRDSIRAPIAKQFRVIAIFNAGFDQYDAKLVYTDLYQAQQFHDTGDSVTGVEMKVKDVDRAKDVKRYIDEIIEGKRELPVKSGIPAKDAAFPSGLHYTMDWEELNHGLFTALIIQQVLMSLVLALIIVVAAFTVIATLIMIVLDKKKEIGVLKAMGASDGAILRAFLYQGGIIGAVGGAIGIGLALLVCKALFSYALPLDPKVYFISHLPVDVQPSLFLATFCFAVIICLCATVWPALHAARLRPADAFREQ